jgi:hypothetical protein
MDLFKRLFFGKAPSRIEHPVLGEALLIEAKLGSYWEIETEVAGKPFTLTVETVHNQEPTEQQVDFFRRFSEHPEQAFAKAKILLVPKFEKWTRSPFPENWRDAFEFVGMSVPLGGDEHNPWDLSFECLKNRERHLFTCSFEQGEPRYVQVDG